MLETIPSRESYHNCRVFCGKRIGKVARKRKTVTIDTQVLMDGTLFVRNMARRDLPS
jgi:hypothetical protein